jgi:HEAT repeat protein
MGLVKKIESPPAPAEQHLFEDPREALRSPDPDRRREAAAALIDTPEAKQLLAELVAVETDNVVREAMLTAIIGSDDMTAARTLAGLLRTDDAALRNAVADTLGQMPAAAGLIDELLADSDPDVRVMTVMLLRSLHLPEVPGWLLEVVASDTDANVVGGALGELGEVGDPTMIPIVEQVAARFPDDPFIAFSAELTARRFTEDPS